VKTLALFLLALGWLPAGQPKGLYAVFNTSLGTFKARLLENEAPVTVGNFVALAQGEKATRDARTGDMAKVRLYDGITFHRVIRGQMIQAGDPTGTGGYDCGVRIRDELLPGMRFDSAGRLAMANTGAPDSGGCQFFITVDAMRGWNGKYTIFGTIVEGQDVVDKINRAPVRGDRPVEPIKLIGVAIERVGPEPGKGKKR
jgi:peptidyl-prolyl cis-trans isomerase A (cyclophilin A)